MYERAKLNRHSSIYPTIETLGRIALAGEEEERKARGSFRIIVVMVARVYWETARTGERKKEKDERCI